MMKSSGCFYLCFLSAFFVNAICFFQRLNTANCMDSNDALLQPQSTLVNKSPRMTESEGLSNGRVTLIEPQKNNTIVEAGHNFLKNWRMHALIAVLVISSILCTCGYWGWDGIQSMLTKSGAFAELCDPSEQDCAACQAAVGALCTIAYSIHMCSAAVSGVLLDRIGPRYTSFIGITLALVAWSLLSAASFIPVEARAWVYRIAAAFLGMSAEPSLTPLTTAADLYEKNTVLVLSILGAGSSLSFAVPVVMGHIFALDIFKPGELWQIGLGYIVIGTFIPYTITFFCIPKEGFKAKYEKYKKKNVDEENTLIENTTETHKEEEVTLPVKSKLKRLEECVLGVKNILVTHLKDPKYLFIVIVFCFNVLRSEFFAKAHRNLLLVSHGDSEKIYSAFSLMNILSFIPCVFVGWFTDKYSPLLTFLILNGCGVLMNAFLLFDNAVCKYIAVVFYMLFMSFIASNNYSYMRATFPKNLFGTLTGTSFLCAGLTAFLSIPLYKAALENGFDLAIGVLIGLGLVSFGLLGYLKYQEKNIPKENIPEENKPEDIALSEAISEESGK